MNLISKKELADRIIGWIRQYGQKSGPVNFEITENTNIMSTGLLDSFGFIELIMFLEKETGCEIDLSDIDPGDFTVVKGLCNYIVQNHPSVYKMPDNASPIIEKYSELASEYDDDLNLQSCWERAADKALNSMDIKEKYRLVLDVGCGTGKALSYLASKTRHDVQFIGIDPATNMRKRAAELGKKYPNVKIMDGCFEKMPMHSKTVDYLYSILAFHWTTDLEQSVHEISRVLKTTGEFDLFFVGRNNGREFIRKTTPIFLKYMGPALLLESAGKRKQLTKDAAYQLFSKKFSKPRLAVEESFETYYDDLKTHWSWWVRIEGHFAGIPTEKRKECDQEAKNAILTLATEKGIPYTVHLLHIKLRCA